MLPLPVCGSAQRAVTYPDIISPRCLTMVTGMTQVALQRALCIARSGLRRCHRLLEVLGKQGPVPPSPALAEPRLSGPIFSPSSFTPFELRGARGAQLGSQVAANDSGHPSFCASVDDIIGAEP